MPTSRVSVLIEPATVIVRIDSCRLWVVRVNVSPSVPTTLSAPGPYSFKVHCAPSGSVPLTTCVGVDRAVGVDGEKLTRLETLGHGPKEPHRWSWLPLRHGSDTPFPGG